MSRTTASIQERIIYATGTAKNRVEALSHYGLNALFISELMEPIRNAPGMSGIHSAVISGISKTADEISGTESKIAEADYEKKLLEMEPE